MPAEIPELLSDIRDTSVDVCVFANILHHFTPATFGESVHEATKKLAGDGSIVVLELFPLLTTERFVIPYSPDRLKSIFREMGFLVSYNMVPVRDTFAYVMVARRDPSTVGGWPVDEGAVAGIVEATWQEILKDAIGDYALRDAAEEDRGYRDVTQCLTTAATMAAWRLGVWR